MVCDYMKMFIFIIDQRNRNYSYLVILVDICRVIIRYFLGKEVKILFMWSLYFNKMFRNIYIVSIKEVNYVESQKMIIVVEKKNQRS